MSDELKSAFELAMERLRSKGAADETPLSDEQKRAIAAIREEIGVKRAEARVLQEQALRAAVEKGDADRVKVLREGHERELAKLDEDERQRIAQVKQ